MADIQSPKTEIMRGKMKEEGEKTTG